MADSFQLKAIITGVNKLSPQLTTMQRDLRKFKGEFKDVMKGVGVAGAAISAMFAVPIKSAIDFESTMADVKKVVDFDNNAQFKQMGEDVLNLSARLPMAAKGIGEIVAAGGQAGIAREDLMQFAEDAVKMGIAFDQTAEESGQMMAQWRTAFKMTQKEVVTLADKVNYLGNTGPANAAKISDIVTRTGLLGSTAGVATGEIAAIGATMAGMGIESEVASTGIKNFMKALTAGSSATKSQRLALKQLRINPKNLSADMQKDAKGTMLKVLSAMSKMPKKDQGALMNQLFGSESAGAIAPLLVNLDLLKENLNKVNDAQIYSGSMQLEYASRAATTANAIKQLKNQVEIAGITLGDMFLPSIVDAAKEMKPFLESVRKLIKDNPELIKTTLKLGLYLMGVAVGVTAITKAISFMNFVTKMSPLGKLLTLVIGAGALIVANWDTVGPVFKSVWEKIKPIVDSLGGIEGIMKGIAIYVAGDFAMSFISGINKSNGALGALNGSMQKLFSYAGKAIAIAVAIEIFNGFNEWYKKTETGAKESGMGTGEYLIDQGRKKEEERGYHGFMPRLKELLGMDSKPSLITNKAQQVNGEIRVAFDNAPQGMNVVSAKTGMQGIGIGYDVGYSRFSGK